MGRDLPRMTPPSAYEADTSPARVPRRGGTWCYGIRTVWPVVLRLSRSMCACAASASG